MVVPTLAVLTVEGFQVPVIPSNDVEGSTGAGDPWQTGGIELNVGVWEGVTVMLKVSVTAHCPAEGVKV